MNTTFRNMGCGLAFLLMLSGSVAWAGPDAGELASIEKLQDTLAAIAEDVAPSVVAIRASRRVGAIYGLDQESELPDDDLHRSLKNHLIPAVGTGIIIRSDGLVLTNEHVIQNAELENIECVLSDGQTYTVLGITSDPRSDLAVLRISAENLTPAKLGNSDDIRQGHFAIVLGNPFGAALDSNGRPAMSFGIISAMGRELTGQLDPTGDRYYGNLIQTDAKINPGNSGGPLLNIRGEVIGINTAISTRSGGSEGVGYAIPIDSVTSTVITRLQNGEEVPYGFLGVSLEAPSPDDRKLATGIEVGGAKISEVIYGAPAAEADLQVGDIIISLNEQAIDDVDDLIRKVGRAPVGVPIPVIVYRAAEKLDKRVSLGRRPVRGVAVSYRWRGMRLANPTHEVRSQYDLPERTQGIVVTHVTPDSQADRAGFEPGQVIRHIGELQISGINTLSEQLKNLRGELTILLSDNRQMKLP